MEEHTFEEKKAWLVGLLIDCPFGKVLDDCPVEAIRSVSVFDSFESVRGMGRAKIEEVLVHHQKCLDTRER